MPEQHVDLRPRTVAQAIEGMALTFSPENAGDLKATIQFHVSSEGSGEWYLDIADGSCRCQLGTAEEPTLTINTPADVWLAIARKEKNSAKALMTGDY